MNVHPDLPRIPATRNVRRSVCNVPACCVSILLLCPFLLQAQAPATAEEEDIRPPRPPVEIPLPDTFSTAQKALLTTPLLALTGFLLWYFLLRRPPAGPVTTPLEAAREALRLIDRERETLPPGDLAEQAALVVRRFIAGAFGLAAPQRTTEEFLKSLTTDSTSPLQSQADTLREFLTTCDKAKFAGANFDPIERFALLETAGRFIQSAARTAAPAPSAATPD